MEQIGQMCDMRSTEILADAAGTALARFGTSDAYRPDLGYVPSPSLVALG
jgi:hypothetical protein